MARPSGSGLSVGGGKVTFYGQSDSSTDSSEHETHDSKVTKSEKLFKRAA